MVTSGDSSAVGTLLSEQKLMDGSLLLMQILSPASTQRSMRIDAARRYLADNEDPDKNRQIWIEPGPAGRKYGHARWERPEELEGKEHRPAGELAGEGWMRQVQDGSFCLYKTEGLDRRR